MNEWDKLAKWIVNNKLFSHNVRWLVQVPRLYEVYKATKSVNNFEDILKSQQSDLSSSTRSHSLMYQMFFSHCSKLPRILSPIPNFMYSYNVWSDLTRWTMNPRPNDVYTRSILTHGSGIPSSPHRTPIGM